MDAFRDDQDVGLRTVYWAQAAGFCQDSSVTWDQVGDLSSSLQRRLDSLR
jgi:hypothetical protein